MESVSQKIIEGMKRKGMTLERLEAVSGISERHIMAIIENKKSKLPAAPYLRGYLMKIGRILDVDGEEIWKEYAKENDTLRQSGKDDTLPEARAPRRKGLPRMLFAGIGGIILVVFITSRFLGVDNPEIRFENLREEVTETSERTFLIRGAITPQFKLTLGEEEIVVQEDGTFEKEVILESGFNTFIFVAKKALGKEHTFPKQVFYEESEAEAGAEALMSEEGASLVPPKVVPNIPEVIQ